MRTTVVRTGFVGVLGLALALCVRPAEAAAQGHADADILARIQARLAQTAFARDADIRVTVDGGVARLSGVALRYADAREAVRLARKEARRVVNLVRVVPESPRPDREVRAAIEAAVLRWDRYGPFDAVSVEVKDGVAHLQGWVDSPLKKEEIEARLASIEGLRDVHNDLRLQGFGSSDAGLRRQIFERIYADPLFERWRGLPDPPVRVFVSKGRVTLAGTVGSKVEQVAVDHIARGTLAFAVTNQVQVEGEAARQADRRKKDGES
jgi:osmotically-inducible protein OsmY